MRHSKSVRVGFIGELYTEAILNKLGFTTYRPSTADHPVDLLVEIAGVTIKLQVKTGSYWVGQDCYRADTCTCRGAKNARRACRRLYDDGDVDFFIIVCDVGGQTIFYVIPSSEGIKQKSVYLYPHRTRIAHYRRDLEMFKGAFNLLNEFANRRDDKVGDEAYDDIEGDVYAEEDCGRRGVMDQPEAAYCQGELPIALC